MFPNGVRQPMPFPVFINDSADHQYAGNTEYPEKDDIKINKVHYLSIPFEIFSDGSHQIFGIDRFYHVVIATDEKGCFLIRG